MRAAVSIARTLLFVPFAFSACTGDTEHPPVSEGTTTIEPIVAGTTLRTGPCADEGEIVTCRVETSRTAAVVNCFVGEQRCVEGWWSDCGAASASDDKAGRILR